jgi:uncharacterized protein (TIGR00255 family)
MILSMTAFARESTETNQGVLTVELRSVNHRYLDSNYKLPDVLKAVEPKFREQISAKLARGKLDILMRLQGRAERDTSLEINQQRLAQLVAAEASVAAAFDNALPVNTLEVLNFPGICKSDSSSDDALHESAVTLLGKALHTLLENRQREGAKLADMIHNRLTQVQESVTETRQHLPELMQQQRDRIVARISDLDIEVDHNRLEQELVHLAQKADVDEELDRLEAHIGEVARTLKKGGPCGRRLDFLMQELNREANTLSSKSFSSSTTQSAVELKVLIEQMREQIQNIE